MSYSHCSGILLVLDWDWSNSLECVIHRLWKILSWNVLLFVGVLCGSTRWIVLEKGGGRGGLQYRALVAVLPSVGMNVSSLWANDKKSFFNHLSNVVTLHKLYSRTCALVLKLIMITFCNRVSSAMLSGHGPARIPKRSKKPKSHNASSYREGSSHNKKNMSQTKWIFLHF